MNLIFWAELDAASDITMSATVEASGSQTRASIIALIAPVAAQIISDDPTVRQAAIAAINGALDGMNALRVYPEGPGTRTSLSTLPMEWAHKTLNDPYGASYAADYAGTWSVGPKRRGEVPVLTPAGTLALAQIPTAFITAEETDQRIAGGVANAIANIGSPEAAAPARPSGWWARLIQQRRAGQPSAAIWAGSSTPASPTGYVVEVAARLQASLYPNATPTPVQFSQSAEFTKIAAAGLHVYNAAEPATTSANYLSDAEIARIGALSPALMVHMIGANDYTSQVEPQIVRANLEAVLNKLDTAISAPCQHVFIHSYARLGFTPPTYPAEAYARAISAVADSHPMGVFYDISGDYLAIGIPGADPLGFILPDQLHQTPDGHAFMAELVFQFLDA